MPSEDARGYGQLGEAAAARKWGLEVVGEKEAEPEVDLRASNGTRYQCKTAVHTTTGGNRGVFRVRREHLRALEAHHQSAVVLVLLPSETATSTRPLKVEKVSTSEVRAAVDHWYPETGHYEVPWPELLSYP